ncbi:YhjD/YihY/BrkB family envelope integrity protein [Kitasatospora sp. NPDC051170]|uniref:YhjD/YihY/BrkB family envelope integrity protein n=1 Tax=Kitasatospora sp. NPDC051170 TaxID=3364056 RepID=UPI00379FA7B3
MTFWLRPAFALRVVGRFQRIVGFDRSMALASTALSALVPLALLVSSVLGGLARPDLAQRTVRRYGLTGGGADAVTALFSSGLSSNPGLGVTGAVLLVISTLSFARAAQRLVEQTWELSPLSVRNTANELRWAAGLAAYLAVTGWLHAALPRGRLDLAATLCEVPVTAAFLLWSGRVLSAKRLGPRSVFPFAVLGAVLAAAYAVGTTVYLPHLFSSYATRYGPVGAVIAMLSALFGAMLVLVGSAALGREVVDELDRIRHGRRPPDDDVRREWDNVIAQARQRWQSARRELGRRSRRRG